MVIEHYQKTLYLNHLWDILDKDYILYMECMINDLMAIIVYTVWLKVYINNLLDSLNAVKYNLNCLIYKAH